MNCRDMERLSQTQLFLGRVELHVIFPVYLSGNQPRGLRLEANTTKFSPRGCLSDSNRWLEVAERTMHKLACNP